MENAEVPTEITLNTVKTSAAVQKFAGLLRILISKRRSSLGRREKSNTAICPKLAGYSTHARKETNPSLDLTGGNVNTEPKTEIFYEMECVLPGNRWQPIRDKTSTLNMTCKEASDWKNAAGPPGQQEEENSESRGKTMTRVWAHEPVEHDTVSRGSFRKMWSTTTENALIDEIEKRHILWLTSNSLYYRKDLKDQEWEELVKALRRQFPNAATLFTVENVRSRWENIKITYHRNKRKLSDSKRSSVGKGDVYQPTWKWWTRLQFLTVMNRTASDSENEGDQLSYQPPLEAQVSAYNASGLQSEDIGSMPLLAHDMDYQQPAPIYPKRALKRRPSDAEENASPSPSEKMCTAFGTYVGSTIYALPEDRRFAAQAKIFEILQEFMQ